MSPKERLTKIAALLKLIFLLLIIIGIPTILYFYFPQIVDMLRDRDRLNQFLLEYQSIGIFLYTGIQAVQVVIVFIPGQIVQLAGGYAYGVLLGTLLSFVGIALGSAVSFGLARVLGREALHVLFDEKRIEKFIQTLNTRRAYLVLFVLFLIPGTPKDPIAYAAGVSEMNLRNFLAISLLGRLPAMMVTVSVGKMMRTENYVWIWIICAITCVLLSILWIYRKKIMDKLIDFPKN